MANVVDMMATIQQVDAVNNRSGTLQYNQLTNFTSSDFVGAHGFVIFTSGISPSFSYRRTYYVGHIVDIINNNATIFSYFFEPYGNSNISSSSGTMNDLGIGINTNTGSVSLRISATASGTYNYLVW